MSVVAMLTQGEIQTPISLHHQRFVCFSLLARTPFVRRSAELHRSSLCEVKNSGY